MFTKVQDFFSATQVSQQEALEAIRLIFIGMFLAQSLFALCIGIALRVSLSPIANSSTLFPQIFFVLSLLSLPLCQVLTASKTKQGKEACISAAIMAAVLLSTPAWYLSMALIIGSPLLYLGLLLASLVINYYLGTLMCGRFARLCQGEK